MPCCVFLFSALALAFCLALLASFVVAMTVIPLFCSRFLKAVPGGYAESNSKQQKDGRHRSWGARFNAWFNRKFNTVLDFYERSVRRALKRPALTLALLLGSPFDYQKQAQLIIEGGLPEPNDPRYFEAVCPRILAHVQRSDGGAFVLFTSYDLLNRCAKWLGNAVATGLIVTQIRPGASPRSLT